MEEDKYYYKSLVYLALFLRKGRYSMKCEICGKDFDLGDLDSYQFKDENNQLIMKCSYCIDKDSKMDKNQLIDNNTGVQNAAQNNEQLNNLPKNLNHSREKITNAIGYISLGIAVLFLIIFFTLENLIIILIPIFLAIFSIVLQLIPRRIKEEQLS